MNKKIKIIDLANNIADEEWNKIPLKISFEGDDFIFNREEKKYKQVDEDYICLCFPTYKLNDEVEILEDNTEEIEEMPNELINTEDPIVHIIKHYKKINELVKAVNELRKEKKDAV